MAANIQAMIAALFQQHAGNPAALQAALADQMQELQDTIDAKDRKIAGYEYVFLINNRCKQDYLQKRHLYM